MANFSVTVILTFTVLLFTLPLCYARLRQPSLPENGINIGTDFPISLLDTEVNPIIRLPIDEAEYQLAEILPENETGTYEITEMLPANETGNNELAKKLPESETVATELVEDLPESETGTSEVVEKTETSTSELAEKSTEMETVMVKSKPLRMARFRRVNRPCLLRHHRHHHLFQHGGNMLIPTGENGDFDRVILHNQLHRIPPRWSSSLPYFHHHHHHHHHHHDYNSDNEESKSVFKRSATFGKDKFKKHFHHDDHEDDEHEVKSFNRKVKNQNRDNKDDGLFQKIRKMMMNF